MKFSKNVLLSLLLCSSTIESVPPADSKPSRASQNSLVAEQASKDSSSKEANRLESIAESQARSGKYKEAASTYADVVRIREKTSAGDLDVMRSLYRRYAQVLVYSGDPKNAEIYKKREFALCEKRPGANNTNLKNGLNSMGSFYTSVQKPALAVPYYERLIEIEQKSNPRSTDAIRKLWSVLYSSQDYARQEPLLRKWLSIEEKEPNSPSGINFNLRMINEQLGVALLKQGKVKEAGVYLELAKKTYEKANMKNLGEIYTAPFLEAYAEFLDKTGKKDEAALFTARAEKLRAKLNTACRACGRG